MANTSPSSSTTSAACTSPKAACFVFGSNLRGAHGKSAALTALRHYGAKYGLAQGRQGNSYAIPTKDSQLKPLSIKQIWLFVMAFLAYARAHPDDEFHVTRVGCGLAGYADKQIAPLFCDAPANCKFDEKWLPYLSKGAKSWGSYTDEGHHAS